MQADESTEQSAPRVSWRLIPQTFGNAWRTVTMVAGAVPGLLAAQVLSQLGDALLAVAIAWVGRHLVDAVVAAQHSPAGVPAAERWVLIELGLVTLKAAFTQWASYTGTSLRSAMSLSVNEQILTHASRVAYAQFEDPGFLNRLNQVRREASGRPLDTVNQLSALLRNGATLGGYVALLNALGPWALAVMALSALPPFWAEASHGRKMFALSKARSQRMRQSFYFESVLTTESTVKEVKLLAMGRWVLARFREVHQSFYDAERSLHRARAVASFALGSLATLAFYGAYTVIVHRTIAGALSLGAMTLYLVALQQGRQCLSSMLSAITRLFENDLYMSTLFAFLDLPTQGDDRALTAEDGAPQRAPEVRFENVSYRYPDAEREALRDVTLTLKPGEALALVGRNGAGKSTLVKLLVGLYQPTAGRILVDGVDIATLAPEALRRQVGVVFQDFARFQFSAGDNIGIGWMPEREDRAALDRAVEAAGAGGLIAKLPRGLDTPLGRAFGGDDLSVGQWQRLALARAFMRHSRVMVLDEPTAALDAEAEHDVFLRLRALREGRTALLITHRFSTVRMADRVVVLDDGAVVEEGTHGELLAREGRYAAMFNLQAEGYRTAERTRDLT